jgi:hypothetical protein
MVVFAVSVVLLLRLQQSLAAPVSSALGSAMSWIDSEALSPRTLARVTLSVAPAITLAHFWLDQHLWRLREPTRRAWVRDRYAFLFT